MRTALGIVILLVLSAGPAAAQDWAKAQLLKSPRHGEWVKLKHGQREVKAFVVYPEIKEKATAVVVIHEIFGLADWPRLLGDELAEAGYIAIVPDLLSGMGPKGGDTDAFTDGDAVRKAIVNLPAAQVAADLDAATDYVQKLPAANGKVAVCGFCWGGGQVWRFANHRRDLKAGFVFYGTGPDSKDGAANIACPIYGFYGGKDNRVNASLPATEKAVKEAGKTFEPVIYENAGHGFMRAGEAPDALEANRRARTEAWERWKTLLKKL